MSDEPREHLKLIRGEGIVKGDLVEILATGERGIVHAVWDGLEDTIEIKLDSGSFTCRDPHHLKLIDRGDGLNVRP